MNSSNTKRIQTDDVLRTMRDMLIEAPEQEFTDLAREAGFDSNQLTQASRKVTQHVIRQSKARGIDAEKNVFLQKGLSSLLVLLRRRDGLDESDLANKADVDEEEIRRIEYDTAYLPSPRTIYKLEHVFSLPSGVLAKISGAIVQDSSFLEERVLEFAANAKSMGKLTRAEHELLNAFVKFLTEKI